MVDNVLIEVAKNLSVGIVNWCDCEDNKFIFKNEFLQSGLNVGAHLYEAKYVQDRGYFIYKLELATKECSQVEYLLELLNASGKIDEEQYIKLKNYAETIRRVLLKICITSKKHI